ncbi:hypothetical protein [Shimazuella kribbensis]|uniref:hypothetical protein n=1 Tax=Shimazuella kribbensis TaxID=139808 RepID=UPI00040FFF56|nr:hypothetical protein [Shimazuella kribbensis]
MKKLFAFALTLCLCLPVVTAHAEKHGSWNYVGEDKFNERSKIINSGGGDFKFCLVSGPGGYYTLWEEDGYFRNGYKMKDEKVGTKKLKKGQCAVFKNINKYVDEGPYESSGQAEFYVTKSKKSGKAHVKFYD